MNRWTSVRLLEYIYSDGLQAATRPSEPSGFFARASVSWNIGILDHVQPSVSNREISDPLPIVYLGGNLSGHFGTGLSVQA